MDAMRFVDGPEAITQRDMLMAWALAEIDSKKPNSLGSMFANNPGAASKTIAGTLTDEQEAAVLGALLYARSALLGFLYKRPLQWQRGKVRLADLAELRPMSYLADAAPSRKMGELVRKPMRSTGFKVEGFSLETMRGCPIAVSDRVDGKWLLVEGHNRCASMISLYDRGGQNSATTDVILGVHPDIPSWSQW